MERSVIRIRCNPPVGFGADSHFMIGINDEILAEGHADGILAVELDHGEHEIQILIRSSTLSSMTGTSAIDVTGDADYRFRYALFGKRAILVPDRK